MIHLLTHSAWRGQLPSPQYTGISPLFKARIQVSGESRRCFIKPLPDKIKRSNGTITDNQEIISEALGYALAKSCGLPVPDNAGVIVLPREYIPAPALELADKLTPAFQRQESFVSWFSEDMRQPNMVQHHLTGTTAGDFKVRLIRRISRHLAGHEQSPAIASFDEWTQNSDRNAGNLLQGPDGKLILIDHGRLFIGPGWRADRLRVNSLVVTCKNQVIDTIEITDPDWSKRLPTQSQRNLAYNGFSVSFRDKGEAAARQTLADLMMEAPEIEHVVEFLASRLQPDHYRKAIGILL